MSQTKAQLISDLVQALNFTGTSSAPANGMYLSAANTIKLATNSNGRLTIDSDGNTKFTGNIFTTVLRRDVQDSSVILSGGNATNDGANIALYGSTHGSQAGNFEFRSGASYVLKIKSDGKVGIGTTNPTETLHVYQSAVDNVNVLLEQGNTNSGNLIQFKQTTTGSVTRTAYIGHGGDATGQLMIQNSGNIYLQTGGSTTALTIDATQNSTFEGWVHLKDNKALYIGSANDLSLFHDATDCRIRYNHTVGSLKFQKNDNSDVMVLDGNGNVGIGTTSPNNKLDVNGGIVCSPNTDGKDTFELSTHGANEGRLRIKNVDTTTIQIRAGGDTYFNGGNVGIGTTSPTVKLAVDGGTTSDATVVQIKNDSTSAYATNDGGLNTALSLFSDGTDSNQGVGIQLYLQKSGETGAISEIGATRESSGNSNLVFRTRDSSTGVNERMRIASNGRVLLGTQKSFSGQSYYDDITINNSNTATGAAGGTGISLISGNNTWGAIQFGDSDDDDVGYIKYSHPNDFMRFATGGGIRFRIDSDGVKFNGDTAAANGLDDYEEGDFTVAVTTHGNAPTLSGTTSWTGKYTKVGNLVHVSAYIYSLNVDNAGTSNLKITGLPFVANNYTTLAITHDTLTSSDVTNGFTTTGTTYFNSCVANGTSGSALATGSSKFFMFAGSYRVN